MPCAFPLKYHGGPVPNFTITEPPQAGYSESLKVIQRHDENIWQYQLMTELPSAFQIVSSSFGGREYLGLSLASFNPDRNAYHSKDCIPINEYPEEPYLAYRIIVNDTNLTYALEPIGSRQNQEIVYFILALAPPLTGFIGVWFYLNSSSLEKIQKKTILSPASQPEVGTYFAQIKKCPEATYTGRFIHSSLPQNAYKQRPASSYFLIVPVTISKFQMSNWDDRVEIGIPASMANMTSEILEHQGTVWVALCIDGIEFRNCKLANLTVVTISGIPHANRDWYHQAQNYIHFWTDASAFRAQKQTDRSIESVVLYPIRYVN